MPEKQIDALDRRILHELSRDGRASARKIGTKLGAATSTISARMGWLERKGIIRGYSANIDYAALGFDWIVLVEIIARKGGIKDR